MSETGVVQMLTVDHSLDSANNMVLVPDLAGEAMQKTSLY